MKLHKFRHRNLRALDAIIQFECCTPDSMRVTEMVPFSHFLQQEMRTDMDIVAAMEEKYIFFADEANIARKLVSQRRPGTFNVYFREA